MLVLLAAVLLSAEPIWSSEWKPFDPCPPSSWCDRSRLSPIVLDAQCADAGGFVQIAKPPAPLHTRATRDEFAAYEAELASALHASRFPGRSSFERTDIAGAALLSKAPVSKFEKAWYAEHLAAMREPELSTRTAETYRFLWLRSFDPPVVVRVDAMSEGGSLIAKVLSGQGGYWPGGLCTRVARAISAAELDEIRSCVRGAQTFAVPRDGVSFDGSEWIMEATVPSYTLIHQQTPRGGAIQDCGLKFLKLAGVPNDPLY